MTTYAKNIIVGCGLSGITLANCLASKGEEVLILDSRSHIGGNCYDYYDTNGICIHKYGTHILHTNKPDVWKYLSQFTDWEPYMHEVKGLVDGKIVPIPFNLDSIETVFPPTLANKLITKLLAHFGFNIKVPILKLREAKDPDLEFLANYIYEKIFLHYTLKQWGLTPEQLDPAVTGRVPVYISRDCRYFQDKYQAIPAKGYTTMMSNMLNHPRITVKLNTSFQSMHSHLRWNRLFYTGSIDEFFNYQYGVLPYRSLHFEFVQYDREFFQSNSVINYPCNYDFTRIGEYKYFLKNTSPKTVVSYEYPISFKQGTERYYPIINETNTNLYNQYLALAQKQHNIYFLGRLGDYKYYDMDNAVARALELVRRL